MCKPLNMFESAVQVYESKTASLFNPICDYKMNEVLDLVKSYLSDFGSDFNEYSNDKLIIEDVILVGSRSRGKEKENSDLDVLVVYSGPFREDYLFNLLHEDNFCIETVHVDFNPIEKGTEEEWLKCAEQYLEAK